GPAAFRRRGLIRAQRCGPRGPRALPPRAERDRPSRSWRRGGSNRWVVVRRLSSSRPTAKSLSRRGTIGSSAHRFIGSFAPDNKVQADQPMTRWTDEPISFHAVDEIPSLPSESAARAAARRATGTRKGEQET